MPIFFFQLWHYHLVNLFPQHQKNSQIKRNKNNKIPSHSPAAQMVTYFCLIRSQPPRDIRLILTQDREKWQNLTFEELRSCVLPVSPHPGNKLSPSRLAWGRRGVRSTSLPPFLFSLSWVRGHLLIDKQHLVRLAFSSEPDENVFVSLSDCSVVSVLLLLLLVLLLLILLLQLVALPLQSVSFSLSPPPPCCVAQ